MFFVFEVFRSLAALCCGHAGHVHLFQVASHSLMTALGTIQKLFDGDARRPTDASWRDECDHCISLELFGIHWVL